VINPRNIYSTYNNFTFAFKYKLNNVPLQLETRLSKTKQSYFIASYDCITGLLIDSYDSYKIASESLNISEYIIRNHVKDKEPYDLKIIFEAYKQKKDIKKQIQITDKIYKNIIIQYDLNMKEVDKWTTAKEIKRCLGFDDSEISKCCRGKIRKRYNYIWKKVGVNLNEYINVYNSHLEVQDIG
jgi:hypothetical protein